MLNEILDLMESHELTLADLYSGFAKRFTATAGFWNAIAIEEKAHADVIKALRAEIIHKTFSLKSSFTLEGIRNSLAFMDKYKNEAKSDTLSELKAVIIALNMERATLESNVFDIFKPLTTHALDELKHLRAHTIEHIKRIEDERAALLKTGIQS